MAKTIARKAYDQALAFAYINDEYRRKPFTLAHVGDDATILMPAAFCNIAFACELFMKAILFTTEEHGDSNQYGTILSNAFSSCCPAIFKPESKTRLLSLMPTPHPLASD